MTLQDVWSYRHARIGGKAWHFKNVRTYRVLPRVSKNQYRVELILEFRIF